MHTYINHCQENCKRYATNYNFKIQLKNINIKKLKISKQTNWETTLITEILWKNCISISTNYVYFICIYIYNFASEVATEHRQKFAWSIP